MKKQIMITILLLAAILISVSACSAANLTVGTGGTYSNIKDAYDAAADDGDTIVIANGTYTGTSNRGITISKNINITGQSQTGTIIDAQGASYIFSIGEGYTVTISQLTLRNGNTTSSGGAIYNNGTLTINKCTFENNTAPSGTDYIGDGGAIYSKGDLTIIDSIFSGNKARWAGGAIASSGTLTVVNSRFTGNNASHGGAIHNYQGTLTVTGSNFSGNAVIYHGGAIYNIGAFTLINSNFTGNNANDNGGAIYHYQGTLTVTGSNFSGNNADDNGGAIFNTGTLRLTDCTFIDNYTGGDGGAIRNTHYQVGDTYYLGTVNIEDSNFINNRASVSGGAISNYLGSWIDGLTISGCNFEGNQAFSTEWYAGGGAIYTNNHMTVNYSRFYKNTAPNGNALYNYGDSWGVFANNNWWGTNTNPMDIPNLIYVYSGSVNVNSWVILSINVTPSTINNGGQSTITADLNHINGGGDLVGGHIPDGLPVTFSLTNGPFGTLTTPLTVNTIGGIASIVFTASQVGVQDVNATLDDQNITTSVTINPAANLFIKVTSNKTNPKVGENFTLTYKLGNYGPDPAENVTITIPLPEGFELVNVSGTGWTYNATTNTITWNLANVPVGDPFLYITGRLPEQGLFVFSALIFSDTYNINSEGVTPVTINAVAVANAVTETTTEEGTVGMQETGIPFAGLILAIFAVFAGLLVPKRK